MNLRQEDLNELRANIRKIKNYVQDLTLSIQQQSRLRTEEEKNFFDKHVRELKARIKVINDKNSLILNKVYVKDKTVRGERLEKRTLQEVEIKLDSLEKSTLKRLGKEEKKSNKKKNNKPSKYINLSNRLFSEISRKWENKEFFRPLRRDLIQANLEFTTISYISVILMSTLIALGVGIILFLFFMFFNITAELPIVSLAHADLFDRFIKTFWIIFAAPIGTAIFMYFYPSMEKKVAATKIEQELPFAAIHMSAISGSMIDPSKIFTIIISTSEYPSMEKEFKKIMNGINIYGYDLVSALRKVAFNGPSKKLSDLLNGLATTITSGGNLPEFFEKRSQSLLFEHRLDREKKARSAETFMDIYISVVIAAPMIFMLLLIMMRISGLGVPISTGMITFLIVFGVAMINVIFLVFLQLRND